MARGFDKVTPAEAEAFQRVATSIGFSHQVLFGRGAGSTPLRRVTEQENVVYALVPQGHVNGVQRYELYLSPVADGRRGAKHMRTPTARARLRAAWTPERRRALAERNHLRALRRQQG